MGTDAKVAQWWTDYPTAGPKLAGQRAPWVAGQAAGKVAVAGCGWGYLVRALTDSGRDAYGFDAELQAVTKAKTLHPAISLKLVQASVLNATQMTNFRKTTMGIAGTTKGPLVVTDDLLAALTDAEVSTALTQLRANFTKVVHIVTCVEPASAGSVTVKAGDLANRSADFVWRTPARVRQLVGTDVVMDAEGRAV